MPPPSSRGTHTHPGCRGPGPADPSISRAPGGSSPGLSVPQALGHVRPGGPRSRALGGPPFLPPRAGPDSKQPHPAGGGAPFLGEERVSSRTTCSSWPAGRPCQPRPGSAACTAPPAARNEGPPGRVQPFSSGAPEDNHRAGSEGWGRGGTEAGGSAGRRPQQLTWGAALGAFRSFGLAFFFLAGVPFALPWSRFLPGEKTTTLSPECSAGGVSFGGRGRRPKWWVCAGFPRAMPGTQGLGLPDLGSPVGGEGQDPPPLRAVRQLHPLLLRAGLEA